MSFGFRSPEATVLRRLRVRLTEVNAASLTAARGSGSIHTESIVERAGMGADSVEPAPMVTDAGVRLNSAAHL